MSRSIIFQGVMLAVFTTLLHGQSKTTAEDSLTANYSQEGSTTIGGYGNAVYSHDFHNNVSVADLERVVLFVGHRFTTDITFFSELEMEDAKVSGGEDGGEIAFEQAYLKFAVDQSCYVNAGLFLPRIGILNENHLPTTFNGNERPQVETYILPSTWRELGVGLYGSLNSFPLNFSAALVNGLNAAGFEHGSGIREGRFEGKNAFANNLAITGALQVNRDNLSVQVSAYYGGTIAMAPDQADSLHLSAGMFGTPVLVGEGDVQYAEGGLSAKILGTIVSIPKAYDINRVFTNNTPQTEYGAYVEIAYNLFHHLAPLISKQLNVFVRYERLDMNAEIPSNGIADGTLDQHHLVAGICYLPNTNVVIKTDIRFEHTGEPNSLLGIVPGYDTNTTFFSLGVGYSF